ncbi:site-specific DNA-methyltransferase [Glaesserella parasuis]|uniref:site-specific DNA-methyltransferase n=1 Tax=Glaesserella parasuis TaxID=738 RepID=UPI0024370E31|nr:site-specific DNA-methyltransferase [Glaesserella parasuis]MDG6285767.1 site-specific DNA-methyltransferase [Glaesserella parasuis]MDG6287970.1 site-specific DNA-methyltransferase [Glaesserella parasuis]
MLKKQTMRGGGKTPLNSNGYDNLQHLVVDTSLFSATFQSALISALSNSLGDFDSHINGTLIHSDNFQALNLLQARYREQVKCIYIDPPYNTGNDGFIYKDGYQSSSWGTLIHNRLVLAKPLLNQAGVIFQSIDDNEQAKLKMISDGILGKENFITQISWRRTDNQPNIGNLAKVKEYILCHSKDFNSMKLGKLPLTEKALKEYRYSDEIGSFRRKILLDKTRGRYFYEVRTISGKILNGPWMIKEEELKKLDEQGLIYWTVGGDEQPYGKLYLDKSKGQIPNDFWGIEYGTNQRASLEVEDLFNARYFDFPKPISLIQNLLNIGSNSDGINMDYFAGSGTTAHAVINLNREDKGNRQYILVEQGEYFDTVLKPRVQKVIYSKAWKDGKPVVEGKAENLQGVPQIVKVLKLESYEDTLNNLELRHSGLFDNLSDDVQQDYLLHYMLNLESRGSLLNVSHFEKPFDYGLNISTTSAGAYEWQKVDLVETFNYLIGAKVINVDDKRAEQGFVAIECRLPNQSADEKTLIFWRDCERIDYDGLQAQFDRLGINPADSEYSQVYVNGDHTLETVWDGEQSGSLKIISIEDAFLSLMFEGDA